jgi:raffinose/stachyose/melibiose transport system permease protein
MKKKLRHKSWLVTVLFSLYGSIVLILMFITVMSSFKTSTEIVTNIFALPASLNWQNYAKVIVNEGFLRYMLNSMIITLVSIICLVIVSCMLAYGHARFQFKGKAFIESYVLLGMMFPIQLGVLINFKIINAMGLMNTIWGLILIYIGNLSLATFLFMRFFRQLPNALAESAKIDGAREFTIFFRIMMPLCKPVIGTVCLVCGLTIYNDFYMPLIFLNGPNRTATVILQGSLTNFLFFIEQIFPMVVISIIPIIILFIFSSEQLIEGLTAGAVKT